MKYLHALNKIEGVGPQKMKSLLAAFGTAQNIWRADLADLQQVLGGDILPERIFLEKQKLDPDAEWEKLEKAGVRLIDFTSSAYPEALKEIHNPPYLIYARGELVFNQIPAISIVGSRKFSNYGEQLAGTFARDLARAGFAIVSGLALGIDAISHRGALEARGKTIAVLGSGIDNESIHPRANYNLAQEIIASGGLVMSDYPPGTPATAMTFPARNRIIAGLSLGTLVIEAGEKSGTLITAKMALESNREVFAIPGSIFSPTSIGTNNLIKSGAKMVTCVQDILEEFNLSQSLETKQVLLKLPENKEEEILLAILSDVPLHIDNIAKRSKLTVPIISATLTMMEIKGWVKNLGGQNYILLQ
ncbi:MAG: DNA-processing protein DprA [Candidatus Moranbacteria bacterium]|nr:DNA-processing protein DprA [Candidatus Moranbacteria bacterium]